MPYPFLNRWYLHLKYNFIQKRYWLRGALAYTISGVIALSVVFVLKIPVLVLVPFNPWWIGVAMDLGMRGSPASQEYKLMIIGVGVVSQIIFTFLVGALIGWVYGKLKK